VVSTPEDNGWVSVPPNTAAELDLMEFALSCNAYAVRDPFGKVAEIAEKVQARFHEWAVFDAGLDDLRARSRQAVLG